MLDWIGYKECNAQLSPNKLDPTTSKKGIVKRA